MEHVGTAVRVLLRDGSHYEGVIAHVDMATQVLELANGNHDDRADHVAAEGVSSCVASTY